MSRRTGLVLWSVLALVGAMAAPPALAADGIATRSDSTFQLLPSQGLVRVTVRIAVTSRQGDTTVTLPCPYDRSLMCTQTTRYYTDKWGYLWVPYTAQDLKVTGATARQDRVEGGWRAYILSFSPVYYGQTRRMTARFDLPDARPRSANPVRVTDAYSHFCWHGQPTDTGSVVAKLPRGYEQDTFGEKVRVKRTGTGVDLRAIRRTDMGEFFACTDAFDLEQLITTTTSSPSGRTILVEGWPQDPDWSAAITGAVEDVLPELEAHVGLPIPGEGDIVIRQVARQALRGYSGEFQTGSDLIRINERYDDLGLIAHELAHAWFDGDLTREVWLAEGFATWLAAASQDITCAYAEPAEGAKPLKDWRFLPLRPTDAQLARVDYQYAAACSIISQIADAMGDDAMQDVMQVLLTDGHAYDALPMLASGSGDPGAPTDPAEDPSTDAAAGAGSPGGVGGTLKVGRDKPADWREWLDVIEEVGLVPVAADADQQLAQQLLLDFGIAKEKDLKGRAPARDAYHELVAALGGRRAPAVVRDLLDRWRFPDALAAIDVATTVAASLAETTATMAPTDARAAWAAYEDAATLKALRAAGG